MKKILMVISLLLVFELFSFISLTKLFAQTSTTQTINISNFAYSPSTITINVGDSVTWKNLDSTQHTVTSDQALWDSGFLNQNGTYTRQFTTAGTYTYHCAVHPFMTGTIIVQNSSASPTPLPTITLKSGDTNNDGVINAFDLKNVLSNWLSFLTDSVDTFGDGRINTLDFARVLTQIGPTPTSIPATPTPITIGENSMAMGIWNPNPKFDTCPSYPAGITTDQQKIDYIKSIHDSYKVKGPDGKWYPTWHPPVDPATGCKFGHEHGVDPKTSPMWDTVQTQFAYDADHDGTIDATEKQTAGLPFGYVNEQLDLYSQAQGVTLMRHEDHVGHKVAVENNVDVKRSTGNSQQVTIGVKCNYLTKVHQGVHSKDAFSNNLHEVVHFAKCDDGQDLRLARMAAFGKAGEFSIVNICGSRIDQIITTGFGNSNPLYPGSRQEGSRGIMDRQCVVDSFFKPLGQWSGFPYETWTTSLNFTSSTGKALVRSIDFLFDVFDSIRYYYPGQPNDLGYQVNTFYESIPNPASSDGVNKWRGGLYDVGTNYGSLRDLTWDDPRSPFKDLHRGMYFKPGDVQNAAGPTTWYTDPFGGNGRTTPFPGSVKQYIVQRDINYSQKYGSPTDPTVVIHEYLGTGVHAPN